MLLGLERKHTAHVQHLNTQMQHQMEKVKPEQQEEVQDLNTRLSDLQGKCENEKAQFETLIQQRLNEVSVAHQLEIRGWEVKREELQSRCDAATEHLHLKKRRLQRREKASTEHQEEVQHLKTKLKGFQDNKKQKLEDIGQQRLHLTSAEH